MGSRMDLVLLSSGWVPTVFEPQDLIDYSPGKNSSCRD